MISMTSLRFLPEQIERWPIARLKPYPKNARTHSDDQIGKIAASLVEYGWTAPVMVADDGAVVAGHAGCWRHSSSGSIRCR
jgi:hypothetical protein